MSMSMSMESQIAKLRERIHAMKLQIDYHREEANTCQHWKDAYEAQLQALLQATDSANVSEGSCRYISMERITEVLNGQNPPYTKDEFEAAKRQLEKVMRERGVEHGR